MSVVVTDKNAEPAFQFAAASYPATEGGPAVEVLVIRRGATAVPVTVDLSTSDGTATVTDGDYTPTSGTLAFGAGVTSASFPVAIRAPRRPWPEAHRRRSRAADSCASVHPESRWGALREDALGSPRTPLR